MCEAVIIRRETEHDRSAVLRVVETAFANAEPRDGDEHRLVERLRGSTHFVPELSLVATRDAEIVGHILFTRITIGTGSESVGSLALAPVAVVQAAQRGGVGAALIRRGHEIAVDLGFESIVVLGHAGYYPKFGYQRASVWGIRAPFDVADENFLAIELREHALSGVHGVVRYAPEFGID